MSPWRRESEIIAWAHRLDAARTTVETHDAVEAMLASYLKSGASLMPALPRLPWNPSTPNAELVPEPVSEAVARMQAPAFVVGRLMDVLCSNGQARALGSCFSPGSNLVRSVFLGTEARERLGDWEQATESMVRHLLDRAEREPGDSGLQCLIGELAVRSARFRRLWADEAPAPQVSTTGEWHHPIVGQLRLTREKTPIAGTDGMLLVVFRPEESVSESALELLRALPVGASDD
ncbi:hypothetical protein [Leifsonia sp. fls2-241-R2A-40a]|uniref:MmyB family transcriptional regulator n=1 Tax=Leifsonia sp. fls2-241-R2A-40a TaxID=3040290 RepID=UPI00254FE8B3|nr:hypothetical protein [Leifsonia sp. fls2-241-R2A-40a]